MPDVGLPSGIRACLFDLDGVLTRTADVHTAAWTDTFNRVIDDWNAAHGQAQPHFSRQDYLDYVDGKPREDGVRSFLASRAIDLPAGSSDDAPGTGSVTAIATMKNDLLVEHIRRDGVAVYEGSQRYLDAVAATGLAVAVVSSSENTKTVLEVTGLQRYVQSRVDGVVLRERGLPGKPDPAGFLLAAQELGVAPAEAAVFEDALAGVAAGRAGDFGHVVGVDRANQSAQLLAAGADVVVEDLEELLT